jgi:hypothetical protein
MPKHDLPNPKLYEASEEARNWRLTSQDADAAQWRRTSPDKDAVDWRKSNKKRALLKGGVRNQKRKPRPWAFILLWVASGILLVTALPAGLALAGFTLYLQTRK